VCVCVCVCQRASFDVATHGVCLEAVWEALRPGVRRGAGVAGADGESAADAGGAGGGVAPGGASADWGEVGFQGSDPCTDFRGGGFLALLQVHSSCFEVALIRKPLLPSDTAVSTAAIA